VLERRNGASGRDSYDQDTTTATTTAAPVNSEDKENEASAGESVAVVNEEKIVENIMKEEIDLRQLGNILYKKKKKSSKVFFLLLIVYEIT
jgi:hypothetical protein